MGCGCFAGLPCRYPDPGPDPDPDPDPNTNTYPNPDLEQVDCGMLRWVLPACVDDEGAVLALLDEVLVSCQDRSSEVRDSARCTEIVRDAQR